MTDRTLREIATGPHREPIRSDAHAVATLGDAPFLAYALMQAFKLFTALVCKRWPQLR